MKEKKVEPAMLDKILIKAIDDALLNKKIVGKHFVYALRLKDGSLHVGMTSNILGRMKFHYNGYQKTIRDKWGSIEMVTTCASEEDAKVVERGLHKYFGLEEFSPNWKGGQRVRSMKATMVFPKENVPKKVLWEKYWYPATQNDNIRAFTRYYNEYRIYQRGLHKLEEK